MKYVQVLSLPTASFVIPHLIAFFQGQHAFVPTDFTMMDRMNFANPVIQTAQSVMALPSTNAEDASVPNFTCQIKANATTLVQTSVLTT